MKEKFKKQKGITLIALIISIIVMLILAVVSINIIMNQGIITKSQDAANTHNKAAEKEAIELAYSKYLTEKYNGEKPTLKISDSSATVTGNEESGWTITYANGNVYTLSKDGGIEGPTKNGGGTSEGTTVGWTDNGDGTITKGSTTLSIGDYVAYNEAGTGTYTADTSKGVGRRVTYSSTTTKNDLTAGEAYTTQNLGWRVLGVNDKGELELISDNPHSETICLANEEGYLYGADELNTMCNTLYGNGTNSAGKVVATAARSLNIDDINKLANYDPKTYEGYGDIWTYRFTTEGNYMQYKRTKENGTLVTDWTDITGHGNQTFRMPGETNTISSNNRSNEGKSLKETYYDYNISEEITNTLIADIIIKGTGTSNMNQWLASTYVRCYDHSARFGIRFVYDGGLKDYNLVYSNGFSHNLGGYRVRPVVTLKSDVQLSGNSKTGWTIQ